MRPTAPCSASGLHARVIVWRKLHVSQALTCTSPLIWTNGVHLSQHRHDCTWLWGSAVCRWAFSIWGIVFLLQGVGVVYQWLPQGYGNDGWKARMINTIGESLPPVTLRDIYADCARHKVACTTCGSGLARGDANGNSNHDVCCARRERPNLIDWPHRHSQLIKRNPA